MWLKMRTLLLEQALSLPSRPRVRRAAGGRGRGIAKRELVQVKGFAFSATLWWKRKKDAQCDTDWNLSTVNVKITKTWKERRGGRERKKEIKEERKMEVRERQVGKRKPVVSVLPLAIFMSLGNIKIYFFFQSRLKSQKLREQRHLILIYSVFPTAIC
jgi:hypothetical protein